MAFSGRQLLERLSEQATRFGAEVRTGPVTGIVKVASIEFPSTFAATLFSNKSWVRAISTHPDHTVETHPEGWPPSRYWRRIFAWQTWGPFYEAGVGQEFLAIDDEAIRETLRFKFKENS